MQKINKDLKADHTLEFTPLNYSFTKILLLKRDRFSFVSLVWYHDLSDRRNVVSDKLLWSSRKDLLIHLSVDNRQVCSICRIGIQRQ